MNLIETFGWKPGEGVRRQAAHLDRLAGSAAALCFAFDRAAAMAKLAGITGPGPLRCRLTLARNGALVLTTAPLPPTPPEWQVMLSDVRLPSDDPLLRHKTTRRDLYEAARSAMPAGVDEVILCNERGEICEGSITNLFVTLDGVRLTPPLACGLLPGVLRAEMLAQGAVREAVLTPKELARATCIEMGNSLRGLIPARLVRTG
ncbi:aminotransferase class IV family protein [Fluviibacterium sp. DFM31]|uniref:Probable branched-chain-amino-acid aminotransferase n=1 Tax=Meridianimarinicoccus marinus TaxID=3231483 RepID=A0ABV3L6X5_9RHOB